MKKTAIILGVCAMCAAAPAHANTQQHMEKKTDYYLKKMDTDNDGSVSKEEHTAFGEKMFGEADKDGDGKLSRQEILDHKMKEKDEMKKAGVMEDENEKKG